MENTKAIYCLDCGGETFSLEGQRDDLPRIESAFAVWIECAGCGSHSLWFQADGEYWVGIARVSIASMRQIVLDGSAAHQSPPT